MFFLTTEVQKCFCFFKQVLKMIFPPFFLSQLNSKATFALTVYAFVFLNAVRFIELSLVDQPTKVST